MKRRILPILLSAALAFALPITSFAADGDGESTPETPQIGTPAVDPATFAHSYDAYQLFTGEWDEKGQNFVKVNYGSSMTDDLKQALVDEVNKKITDDNKKIAKETTGDFVNDYDPAKLAKAIGDYYKDDTKDSNALAKIIFAKKGAASNTKISSGATVGASGWYLVVDVTENVPDGIFLDRTQLQVVKSDLKLTITEKRDTTTSFKKVRDKNDSLRVDYDGWEDSADYDIGDEIPFQITATIPANYDDYETFEFVFHDKQDAGLTFQKDTVEVTVDGAPVTGYTVKTDDVTGETFQIAFADLKKVEAVKAGSKIVATYKSILNENALIGAVGNKNEMRVTFKNDWGYEGKTPWDTVIVFTFQANVDKVDQDKNPLTGAEFKLEKFDKTANDWVELKDKDGSPLIKVDESGTKFSAKGIDDGIYRIEETKTHDGYNKLVGYVYFVVIATHDADSATPALQTLVVSTDWKDYENCDKEAGDIGTFDVVKADGTLTTQVINQQGAVLPSTGGIGTTIFYVIGGVLVVGAVVLLIVRRRMRNEEE